MMIRKKAILMVMAALCLNLTVLSQSISLEMRNVTVKEAMAELKTRTGYSFVFSSTDVNTKKKISLSLKNGELGEAIEQILQGQNLTYEIKEKNIVVKKEDPKSKSENSTETKKPITGTVLDSNGEPIIGANILEEGTNNGVITDLDGRFSLSVTLRGRLVVSFIGYQTQYLTVSDKASYRIVLLEDSKIIDEVVVVGYGTQRKGNLTGSVSLVKSEQLTIAPVANVTHTLAGQLPGLIAKQNSGQPGADDAELNLRGFGSPLVIVDGVESSLSSLDASQIESISILKDGSASIYGARAGNGVVLVTTKRGQNQKPTITLNTSLVFQGVTDMLKPMSSGQRAQMAREMHLNEGKPESTAPYTEEEVRKYFEGTDPNYPNTDWYGHVFRDWAPEQVHNISIRGGSEKIKYYGFFGYTKQSTMVKKNGGDFKRYNAQSNMDAQVTDRLSVTVDLSLAFEDRYFPSIGMGNGSYLWNALYDTDPRYPHTLPDPTYPSYGGINLGSIAIASNTENGYRSSENRFLRGNVSFTYDFKYIKGLKAKAYINYNDYYSYNKMFNKQIKLYTYNHNSGEYLYHSSTNGVTKLTESIARYNNLTQQYSLIYNNTFAEDHAVSGLALFECIDYSDNNFEAARENYLTSAIDQLYAGGANSMTNNGSASEMGRASFVGRINYAYKNKYLLETILRADASAKFPKDSRWGYFPSVSLGWVITEEAFMKGLNYIDNIKIRGSYGESGNDAVGNFQYLSGYALRGNTILGDNSLSQIYSTGLANPSLTWEKMKIFNLGVDFSFLNRMIYGTVEGFYRKRTGIPANRLTSLPSTFGASLPVENLNSLNDRGFEISLGSSGKLGQVLYDFTGNISWSRSKWDHFEEPVYEDPDQERLNKKSGNYVDRNFGYISDGLFTSQEEIDNLPYVYKDLNGNSSLRPGDVKLVDVNKDGFLDQNDRVYLGGGSLPHWMYGFSGVFRYKNFDLTALFQGAFGFMTYVDIYNTLTATKYDLRWTPENNDRNALVPRLGGAASNTWNSDYYYKKTSYLRLKSASIGYELPKQILEKIKFTKVRLYIAGTNLFTLSNLRKYGVDPEMPGGVGVVKYYPQQRTVSFGANISF